MNRREMLTLLLAGAAGPTLLVPKLLAPHIFMGSRFTLTCNPSGPDWIRERFVDGVPVRVGWDGEKWYEEYDIVVDLPKYLGVISDDDTRKS